MSERDLVRFGLENGGSAIVEVTDLDPRARYNVAGGVFEAGSFESALHGVVELADATLAQMRRVQSDELELEFSLKLSAEAGAVIVANSGEGHLKIRVKWRRGTDTVDY